MTRPQPRSIMPSHTCLVMLKQESRFACITASQLILSIFLKVISRVIPALLTSTSTAPRSSVILRTQARQDSQSVTSQGYAWKWLPCLFIDSSHIWPLVLLGE